jgi:hypothetical protein
MGHPVVAVFYGDLTLFDSINEKTREISNWGNFRPWLMAMVNFGKNGHL